MELLLFFCVIVIVVVFAKFVLVLAFRKEYKVQKSGVVVISGTSSGIGHHAAFTLALHGYEVFCGVRSEKDLTRLRQEAVESHLESYVHPILLDVSKPEQVGEVLREVSGYLKEHRLPLVGVVNNAGINTRTVVETVDFKEAREVFDVNFWGALSLTQAFLPIIRRDQGRVVFVSSLNGIISLRGRSIYCASKYAIISLAESLRLEMIPFGVSVSLILPGYIKTAIAEKSLFREDREVVPPSVYEAYRSFFETYKQQRRESFANVPGPEVTSAVILHALSHPFPQTRYYPGNGGVYPGWFLPYFVALVPDRLKDRLMKEK